MNTRCPNNFTLIFAVCYHLTAFFLKASAKERQANLGWIKAERLSKIQRPVGEDSCHSLLLDMTSQLAKFFHRSFALSSAFELM